ncbi:hypothetical protein [Lysobacter capsici]|uniref:hypothetical protein n=1 Tax=Lysobacter capsici TaxID=435897 RepID=UPI000716691C|nr:hypothetical protein [Lysobacter capsici]
MGDVRELLGRLNPTNVKFDIGQGGGVPDLTPQDIAAALAFVPVGLGREVFARLWWPDGARLSPFQLDRLMSNMVHTEAARRRHHLAGLQTDLHMLEEIQHVQRASTGETRDRIASMQRRIEEQKRKVWPHSPVVHVAIREAVLLEMARPNLCVTCAGWGMAFGDDRIMAHCATCGGHRVVASSDRARAARIGRDESSYRASWKGLYEWLFGRVLDAEQDAARELSRALRRHDDRDAA